MNTAQMQSDRYLKNGVSESIVHVIKHADFQFSREYSDKFISKSGQFVTNI